MSLISYRSVQFKHCLKLIKTNVGQNRTFSLVQAVQPNFKLPVQDPEPVEQISNPYGMALTDAVFTSELPPICGEIYRRLRDEGHRRFRDAPADGLTSVRARYFDNINYVGGAAKRRVLMLHGTPGNHLHFSSLIKHLTDDGVRVIAPHFPNLSLSEKCRHWRHSAEERGEFLKALADVTGVRDFDAILTHSSGVYSSCTATVDGQNSNISPLSAKSYIWFNPCGLESLSVMKPEWFITPVIKMSEHRVLGPALDIVGRSILKVAGNAMSGSNSFRDSRWGGYTNLYTDRSVLREKLTTINEQKIPTTIVYSTNDRVVTLKMTENVLNSLNASSENADIYDHNGKLVKVGCKSSKIDEPMSDWFKLVQFTSGGHFSYLKNSAITCRLVSDHLQKLV